MVVLRFDVKRLRDACVVGWLIGWSGRLCVPSSSPVGSDQVKIRRNRPLQSCLSSAGLSSAVHAALSLSLAINSGGELGSVTVGEKVAVTTLIRR